MDIICRTCLRSSLQLLPLFDDLKLPHKIQTIASIEVLDIDNLPNQVCTECVRNIDLSYNFRKVIINSDLELRDRLACINKEPLENVNGIENEILNIIDDKAQFTDTILRDEHSMIIPLEDDDSADIPLEENESIDIPLEFQIEIHQLIENHSIDIPLQGESIDNPLLEDNNQDTEYEIEFQNVLAIAENDLKNARKNSSNKDNKVRFRKSKLFKCDKCDFETLNFKKRKTHIQTHLVSICTICGKTISAAYMTKHIATHTDSPVTCKHCGKICKNSESLRGHILIHTGINRKCKICGELYTERRAYTAHVKTHTEQKTVTCTLCNKVLHSKEVLKKHLRSHTGERPYLCEFCQKGFSSSHALKTHIRQHTNERPYKCTMCPMDFPQKVSLRTHLKSKHGMKNFDIS